MCRGSREYFPCVIGSTMSAMTLTVGFSKNGSMHAVSGSGTASMSDMWIPCQPRIEEPSNPRPSMNVSSSSTSIGNEQCCHVPSRSTNFKSIISEPFFFMYAKNSLGVIHVSFPKPMECRARVPEIGRDGASRPHHVRRNCRQDQSTSVAFANNVPRPESAGTALYKRFGPKTTGKRG